MIQTYINTDDDNNDYMSYMSLTVVDRHGLSKTLPIKRPEYVKITKNDRILISYYTDKLYIYLYRIIRISKTKRTVYADLDLHTSLSNKIINLTNLIKKHIKNN